MPDRVATHMAFIYTEYKGMNVGGIYPISRDVLGIMYSCSCFNAVTAVTVIIRGFHFIIISRYGYYCHSCSFRELM